MLIKKINPNFSTRSTLPEIMDMDDVSADITRQALGEIDTINRTLGGYTVILNALESLPWPQRQVVIMDLGSGGGDTLRAIATWAKKKKRQVKLIGVDRNPVMTEYAASRSRNFANIEFVTMSVFDERLADMKADITMNSLFCHHFDNDELATLIRTMYNIALHSVIINDIDRHWFAYYSIKALTAIFAKTDMVKYDAPLSVARSLTKQEWENVLQQAGIKTYAQRWMWAWRWQIIIPKTPENAG